MEFFGSFREAFVKIPHDSALLKTKAMGNRGNIKDQRFNSL